MTTSRLTIANKDTDGHPGPGFCVDFYWDGKKAGNYMEHQPGEEGMLNWDHNGTLTLRPNDVTTEVFKFAQAHQDNQDMPFEQEDHEALATVILGLMDENGW